MNNVYKEVLEIKIDEKFERQSVKVLEKEDMPYLLVNKDGIVYQNNYCYLFSYEEVEKICSNHSNKIEQVFPVVGYGIEPKYFIKEN